MMNHSHKLLRSLMINEVVVTQNFSSVVVVLVLLEKFDNKAFLLKVSELFDIDIQITDLLEAN